MPSTRFISAFSLGLALVAVFPAGGGVEPDGSRIYRAQCASCHGRDGQGVKGEYEDVLSGEWSVERLTRYIHKSMPEEHPERCVDADAAAVARYVHGEFYSPEARLRLNPPRVELVRLTNRQYVNTAADLVKSFTGSDPPVQGGGGLAARYESGARIQGIKGSFDRVDPLVRFDFGTNSPDAGRIQADKFQIGWRGSVIAEDSGDYEFVVRTPNGFRLFVNNPDVALIDAYVASGAVTEHRAAIRLIGGRAYPIALEFFKFKDKTASVALEWKPPHGPQRVIPSRNLTPERTSPTFVVTTRFPADDSSVGYERGVSVSKAWDESTTYAAIEVAHHVLGQLDALSHSRKDEPNRGEKLREFSRRFIEGAWRRPLNEEEVDRLVTAQFEGRDQSRAGLLTRLWRVFDKPAPVEPPPPEDATKRVVLLALKSPEFLYLGLNGRKPDDFIVASRLSYGLWDSLPDEKLLEAAERGALRTPEQVRAQAWRMIKDPRAAAKVRVFLHHWLQVDRVEDLAKDEKLFPGFSPELIADLRTSLDLFLDDVFWNDASDYRRLMLEEQLHANGAIAAFYGLSGADGDRFAAVQSAGNQRAGVITHPYLLAAFSYPRSSSPIHRGVFLTRNVVGRVLKQPPVAAEFKEEDFDPSLTMREKVAQLTRGDACQSCHSMINPLGFSLEQFDAVGRYRTRENNREVDASAEFEVSDGEVVRFNGARDVARFAAESREAHEAFIEQMFHQVVKQPMLAYGIETPRSLHESFVEGSFNMQRLMIEIAVLSALHGTGSQQTASHP